ncbi:ribosomal protein L16, L13 [Castilleja foliolosa]|uniref:Ribosomal protein L16, L13 n=1 Tax=Castilleja foliolosa TaxID=1961234 RepID=A0ABD3E3A7_9LAMI
MGCPNTLQNFALANDTIRGIIGINRNFLFQSMATDSYYQYRCILRKTGRTFFFISFPLYGKYALQALEPAWITSRQIEAGRRAMTRNARRGGKIWVRIFPDKPVTVRPAETRMGSGKGSPEYWVAVVKPGRILYEMGGVTENIARRAILIAASKMPIRTQFIILA